MIVRGSTRIVVALGMAASLVIVSGSVLIDEREHRSHVAERAAEMRNALELRFSVLEEQLLSFSALFSTAEGVDPAAFARFYELSGSAVERETLRAVALMAEVDASRLDRLQAFVEERSEAYAAAAYPEFDVFPESDEPVRYPVVLVEPAASRERVFGFDLSSSPDRLQAARLALETGRPALSAPVSLSQDASSEPVSLLLIAPVDPLVVFPGGLSAEAGSSGSRGLVASSVTPARILSELLTPEQRERVCVTLSLMRDGGEPLKIGEHRAVPSGERFTHSHDAAPVELRFGDRMIRLEFSEREGWFTFGSMRTLGLAGLCVLATSLATAYARRRDREAEIVASELSRKEAALREAERSAAQSNKLEAVGRLVAGVAHDFNNLLTVIMGNLEMIRDAPDDPETPESIEEALRAVDRGGALTRQLLSFGRRAYLQPCAVDLGLGADSVATTLRRVLPESISVEVNRGASLKSVQVDPNQLETAVLNLAINARDAMPDGGRLTLTTRNVSLNRRQASALGSDVMPGDFVLLDVSDTGSGMPPDVAAMAFEPFFTTKGVGEGSGLGLSMVFGFVSQSGGAVRLVSQPGDGTSIRLYFPASGEPAPKVERRNDPRDVEAMGAKRVLVVEDEASVRRVLVSQLSSAGYAVDAAESGDVAVALLGEGLTPDLIVTDAVMPGAVQGSDLAAKASEFVPDAKVIVVSGYPDSAGFDGVPRHRMLRKPVDRNALLVAVADALAEDLVPAQ